LDYPEAKKVRAVESRPRCRKPSTLSNFPSRSRKIVSTSRSQLQAPVGGCQHMILRFVLLQLTSRAPLWLSNGHPNGWATALRATALRPGALAASSREHGRKHPDASRRDARASYKVRNAFMATKGEERVNRRDDKRPHLGRCGPISTSRYTVETPKLSRI
jgi:hypothetical protein